jgi:hypothetical protein
LREPVKDLSTWVNLETKQLHCNQRFMIFQKFCFLNILRSRSETSATAHAVGIRFWSTCRLPGQEMLGYNTTLNLDNLGSGALSGYYGLTGCSTPTNTDDRGCIEGVPWQKREVFVLAVYMICSLLAHYAVSFVVLWITIHGANPSRIRRFLSCCQKSMQFCRRIPCL